MSKTVVVEIGEKPVTFDTKVFGRKGKYEVDERTARNLVNRGKAKIIKGKLPKQEDPDDISTIDNKVFLNRIRQNAGEILAILNAEANKAGGLEIPAAFETETESKTETDEDDSNADKEMTSGNEESSNETSSDDIPDDFPGKEILAKNNITKISQIPTDREELMKLDQMTGRVANLIGVKRGQSE